MIVDALRDRHSLPLLLERFSLSRAAIIISKRFLGGETNTEISARKSRNCSMRPRGVMDTEGYTGYWNVKGFSSQKSNPADYAGGGA